MKRATTVFALLVSLVACAGGRQDVMSAHDAGKGEQRIYAMPIDAAWGATRAALQKNHAEAIEEHRDQGYMVGTAPASGWSYGASMGAWLTTVDASHTRIQVIVSRKLATTVGGQSETSVLDDIR